MYYSEKMKSGKYCLRVCTNTTQPKSQLAISHLNPVFSCPPKQLLFATLRLKYAWTVVFLLLFFPSSFQNMPHIIYKHWKEPTQEEKKNIYILKIIKLFHSQVFRIKAPRKIFVSLLKMAVWDLHLCVLPSSTISSTVQYWLYGFEPYFSLWSH